MINLFNLIILTFGAPSPINSTNDSKYYLHLIDAYSKFTLIYLLQSKSQALSCFIHFQTIIENQIGLKFRFFKLIVVRNIFLSPNFLLTVASLIE